jgi:hypothetical protein
MWPQIRPHLLDIGFAEVVFDPAGYRRGGADPPRE